MASRPRKHIPLEQLLASALADKLSPEERKELRDAHASAKQVIRMFTADHIVLHCWDGDDRWWNIDMRRRGAELKAKDASDTSRAAKAVRIDSKWSAFMSSINKSRKPAASGKGRWPKRSFPKRQTRSV